VGSYYGHQRSYDGKDQTHYHDRPDEYSGHQRSNDSQDRTMNYNQRGYLRGHQGSLDQHIDSKQSTSNKWTGPSNQRHIEINSNATADSSENTGKDYG